MQPDVKEKLYFQSDLSMLHPFIKDSIEYEYGHHRTPWMKDKLSKLNSFFCKNLGQNFIPLTLTNTHLGTLEAAILNLYNAYEHVCTSENSRWAEILGSLGIPHTISDFYSEENYPTGKTLFLLEDTYFEDDNFLPIISKINTRGDGSSILFDISNFFALRPINWGELLVDGYVVVPERALGAIPGMSILALRKNILEGLMSTDSVSSNIPYTLDLSKYYVSWKKEDTPYSPDISSLVALSASIELIELNGGIKSHITRQERVREFIHEIFSDPKFSFTDRTGGVTEVILPKESPAKSIHDWLIDNNCIHIEGYCSTNNSISIGHTGYVSINSLNELQSAIFDKFKIINPDFPSLEILKLRVPDLFLDNTIDFEIGAVEFYKQASLKAKLADSKQSADKILQSAKYIFNDPYPKEAFVYKNRTLGFIGAGNTVRETVKRCLGLGINNIIVYSPSLAEQLKNDSNNKKIKFWSELNVTIAKSSQEVFLRAHTVVLLPTYYDEQGVELLGKNTYYLNKNLIDDNLLNKIRDEGKMDLLINASARSELIDRNALTKHLNQGWLRFVSDETPYENDPVSTHEEALMTGHIGGSADVTKEKIALNTREILKLLILELQNKLAKDSSDYVINLLNSHLKPELGWRSEYHKPKTVKNPLKLKILLTDIFDIKKLDFTSLSSELGVEFEIIGQDMDIKDEKTLIESIKKYSPNILMIRTKTIITEEVATALSENKDFYFVIRPGVGVENIYPGMYTLSANGIKIINEPFGNSSSVGEMTSRFIIRSTPKVIMTPGPTPHNLEVFKAIEDYTTYTDKEFEKSFQDMRIGLKSWLQLDHGPVVTSSPSTGLMEAGIRNLTKIGQHGLVISHGKFGNRFIDIGKQNNRTIHHLQVTNDSWGKAFSITDIDQKILELMKSGIKISFLCIQQNETSSGVSYRQSDLEKIVKIARDHNEEMIIVIDAVSGLFAHHLDFSRVDADMVITGSQKGLGVSSGISYATLSNRAVNLMIQESGYDGTFDELSMENDFESKIKTIENEKKVRYFSLLRLLLEQNKGYFSSVPSIFHILSTNNSLKILDRKSQSDTAFFSEIQANLCRAAATELGLDIAVIDDYKSSTVTPILLNGKLEAPSLRKELEEKYGLLVSGAQNEELKSRMIRIGHTGYVKGCDTVRFIRALKILINEK